ncbi:hypothetical protein HYT26_04085 [Candidatus Pacearchaeota archaeon]|nr:hypothetical protein [Candidatus Pacearchaeota archaeon]
METKYSIIQEKQAKYPARGLIRVKGDRNFIASLSAFGPGTYKDNQAEMQKQYSHPETGETISFKPATTAETILINAYDFENRAKPEIFDPRWLQVGKIVRTPEGVFANPPVDRQGSPITDEKTLKSFLKTSKKVNGIYLLDNDLAFAPYETFSMGVQDCDTFAQGGLARILEYTEKKEAENLRAIASPKFYTRGVNVWGFDSVKEPILLVACLGSCECLVGNRLSVDGYDLDGGDDGYAYGILDSGEASAKNSK